MFGALGWLLEMCCTLLLQTNTKGTVFWSKTKLLDKIVLLGVCFFCVCFPALNRDFLCLLCLFACLFLYPLVTPPRLRGSNRRIRSFFFFMVPWPCGTVGCGQDTTSVVTTHGLKYGSIRIHTPMIPICNGWIWCESFLFIFLYRALSYIYI